MAIGEVQQMHVARLRYVVQIRRLSIALAQRKTCGQRSRHDASGLRRGCLRHSSPGDRSNLGPVTLFTALEGFKLYEVVAGGNMTQIAREQGQNTTVEDILQANRDRIDNANLIFPGQILRIPLLA